MPVTPNGPLPRLYLAIQSSLIFAWWMTLILYPDSRAYFSDPAVGGDRWLLWYAPADLLTAIGGLLAAWRWQAYAGRVGLVLSLIGISTQTIGCLSVPLRTGGSSGWLAAILMLAASIGTLACAGQMLVATDGLRSVFRSAPATTLPRTLAWRTVRQAAVLWLLFLLVLPLSLVFVERRLVGHRHVHWAWTSLGQSSVVQFFLAGSILNITATLVMVRQGRGTPLPTAMASRLVDRGPYAHVRNPMAIGGLGQGLGAAILLASPLTALYVLLGGIVWQVLIRPAEERDLRARFGSDYDAYRARVRCWWPTSAASSFAPPSDPAKP